MNEGWRDCFTVFRVHSFVNNWPVASICRQYSLPSPTQNVGNSMCFSVCESLSYCVLNALVSLMWTSHVLKIRANKIKFKEKKTFIWNKNYVIKWKYDYVLFSWFPPSHYCLRTTTCVSEAWKLFYPSICHGKWHLWPQWMLYCCQIMVMTVTEDVQCVVCTFFLTITC